MSKINDNKSDIGAYALLFNADAPELGNYYGYPCNHAFACCLF